MTRRPYKGTPEGAVLASILEYLAVEKIWHRRMQSRVVDVVGKGGKARPMFFGTKGMADILATPTLARTFMLKWPAPLAVLWIEAKSATGKQSPAQVDFEREVRAAGHEYLLARSIDDVKAWLEANR